jgi:hypothetical protein
MSVLTLAEAELFKRKFKELRIHSNKEKKNGVLSVPEALAGVRWFCSLYSRIPEVEITQGKSRVRLLNDRYMHCDTNYYPGGWLPFRGRRNRGGRQAW